jgi:uncharacterized membrane protein
MILAAVGLLLALVASALAVDLGRQAAEKKSDHLIADLAALDAVRELQPLLLNAPGVSLAVAVANAGDAAKASAKRNGFDPVAAGNSVATEVGTVDNKNAFTPGGATVNAVRVTVGSTLGYIFAPGGKDLAAKAIARLAPSGGPGSPGAPGSPPIPPTPGQPSNCCGSNGWARGGLDLGSALASADFDAVTVPVLNKVFGQMIGGNADLISWKGLGGANVTMSALSRELGTLGLDVGTPQKLLAADLTLNKLFTATASALDQQGTSQATAAAALFRGAAGIILQSKNTTTFKLAQIMSFDQGTGTSVADANLKVRDLVVAAAEAANGSNVVSVPTSGVTVPDVSNTAVTLQIIEPMKHLFGPVGSSVETAQVKMTVTPTIDDSNFVIPGLNAPKITGAFPVTLDAAGAKATITTIDCVAPGMIVGVDTKPATGSGSGTLRVTQTLPVVGTVVPVLDAPTVMTGPSIAAKHTDLPFSYSTEFHPFWDGSKRAGTTPLNLAGADVTVTGVTVLSLPVGVPQLTVTDKVIARVRQHLQSIENKIVTPLVRSLGLTVAVADVAATDLNCVPGAPPVALPPTGGTPGVPGTPPTPGTPPSGPSSYRPVLVG